MLGCMPHAKGLLSTAVLRGGLNIHCTVGFYLFVFFGRNIDITYNNC